jgi:hypothetical protein
MSHPLLHAERSAQRWGGTADDYLPVHRWLDSTQAHCPDVRHRLLLHNSFGIGLAEQMFGLTLTNSAGQRVFVREIAAQHVLEDLGCIPTVAECLAGIAPQPWMAGARKRFPVPADPPLSEGDPSDHPRPLPAPDRPGAP